MSYHGRFEAPKPRKKRGGRIALIVILIFVVLIIGIIIAGLRYYDSVLDKVTIVETPKLDYSTQSTEPEQTEQAQTTAQTETTEAPLTTAATEAPHVASSEDYINILLVGQASRYGEEERFADTMILCTINKYEKTLTMTSFLRDAFAKMPDYKGRTGGRIKLTTIYHLGSVYGDGIAGSMELMNMALYQNFGVEVDYNVEVDFDAFTKIIDMLGGLDVELSESEVTYLNTLEEVYGVLGVSEVELGWNNLDGYTALQYARMRKAEGDGDSDIKRTSRQRQLISNLLKKLMTRSVSELNEMANEILPMITTNMSKDTITEMLLLMIPMLKDLQIQSGGTCPVEGTYWGDSVDIYGDGFYHSVLRFEASQQKPLMRAITEGEVAE